MGLGAVDKTARMAILLGGVVGGRVLERGRGVGCCLGEGGRGEGAGEGYGGGRVYVT